MIFTCIFTAQLHSLALGMKKHHIISRNSIDFAGSWLVERGVRSS